MAGQFWLAWLNLRKLKFTMPGLKGVSGLGRLLYIVDEPRKRIYLLWSYTHQEVSKQPPAKDLEEAFCTTPACDYPFEADLTITTSAKRHRRNTGYHGYSPAYPKLPLPEHTYRVTAGPALTSVSAKILGGRLTPAHHARGDAHREMQARSQDFLHAALAQLLLVLVRVPDIEDGHTPPAFEHPHNLLDCLFALRSIVDVMQNQAG